MDCRQLEIYLEVCQFGTLTAAASHLGISEQAASKAIKSLESELCTQLLVRGGRGVSLTADGEVLQGEARSYVAHHKAVLKRFRTPDNDGRSVLSVAAASGAMAQWLPEHFITDFMKDNPDIQLELFCYSEDSYNRPRHALGREVILCTSLNLPDGWEVAVHKDAPLRIVVGKRHPFAGAKRVRIGDLAGMQVAMAIDETPTQTKVMHRLEEAGARLTLRFGPAEIPLLNDMLRIEPLVVLFGGSAMRIPDDLVVVDVDGLDANWDFYVLRRANLPVSEGPARKFISAVAQALDAGKP